LKEAREAIEKDYKKEFDKMMLEINLLKQPILTKDVFSDSAILTTD
jgi:hypothetical protein